MLENYGNIESVENYEEEYFCPLLEQEISDSECYDIQMVRCGFIKEHILNFKLNYYKALKNCEYCPFNQLEQLEQLEQAEQNGQVTQKSMIAERVRV